MGLNEEHDTSGYLLFCRSMFSICTTETPARQTSAGKSQKVTDKVGSATNGKGVKMQKDVSLAAVNPRAPVTRSPGPGGKGGRGPPPV